MNQDVLPLYNCLLNHTNSNPISFHVPGHKNGTVFPPLNDNIYNHILKIDQTELRGLDDLHSAAGVIKEAQDLTASLYKVKRSYFLVGGSTVGNLAMILATCEANDTILVQRNCHKSIINGLKLANVNPVFLSPEYDHHGHFSTNVSRETVELAIIKFPDAKVLILTSPNYYGMVSKELCKIIELARTKGIIVLVDEAHGAHFILGKPFPPSAIELGADLVVQSAHKTLPAMTMGSFLHYNSIQIDSEKLNYYLQVVQSSSPSYPIMASLDIARYYLAHICESNKKEIVDSIYNLHKQLSTIPQLAIINPSKNNYADPIKLILQTRCSLSGYDLQKQFEKHSVYTELADPWNVLFVLPLEAVKNWEDVVQKIKRSVQNLPVRENPIKGPICEKEKISTLSLPYYEMKKYEKEIVPIHETEGHISATSIIPYPPGIPLILEGEKMTTHHLEQLFLLKERGAYFQNNPDIWINGLEVYK